MAGAFVAAELRKRYGVDRGTARGLARGRRGRDRRPAGTERGRQVDPGEDRLRARPGERRRGAGGRPPGRLARRRGRRSATWPSSSAFPAWARAEEVLRLHQRLAGSRGGAAERTELLELVGLREAAMRRVAEMSKGMQQRLGIAQALVGEPRLLLLDEPTSALDPAGRRVVRELLAEVRSRGISVLLSSHLLGEVERVCDRVAILVARRGGRARDADRARPPARDRDRDRERDAGCSTASAARTRRGSWPSWSPPASRSTACGCWRARSRTSTSRRSGRSRACTDRAAASSFDAGARGGRLRLRREPAAQGVRGRRSCSPLVFLVLFGIGVKVAFDEVADQEPDRRRPARRADAGRLDRVRPGDVRDPVPRRRAGGVHDRRRRPRRRRDRAAAAAGGASARPRHDARRPLGRGGAWRPPSTC